MTDFAEILKAYQAFPQQYLSLMLSTADANGNLDASYAPFVKDEAYHFYIFVSGLSPHTQNLLSTAKASILLIDDEANTPQIFARRRLSYSCSVTPMSRDTEAWQQIIQAFHQRFGEIIDVLSSLQDFQLMRLTPDAGRFVVGFGAAYEVDPENPGQLLSQPLKKLGS